MKKFEYLSQTNTDIRENANRYPRGKPFPGFEAAGLNYLGLQGWELVNFTSDGKYIFKREILPAPEHAQGYQERTQNGYTDGYGR